MANQILTMNSVELFTGAGGLAIGISNAGFHHQAAIERDKDACFTILSNQQRGIQAVADWPVFQADVSQFDFTTLKIKGEIDLLAGGPPCQPFSQGGKHQGWDDKRDMFPQFFRAVRELKPLAILVENVKGLLRSSFSKYFEYIILQLTYPEIVPKPGEDWVDHLSRLERHHTVGRHDGLSYRVVFRNLNAADYGIPQKRDRVFMVGFRSDLGVEWSFPAPTHSQEAMLWEQWVTGDYWERHQVPHSERPQVPSKQYSSISNLQSRLFPPLTKPWRTVRDAIWDLPVSGSEEGSSSVLNHVFMPGARKYPGHTGSPLDEPAKTLKAGVHGVPGGENMLAFHTGEVRYFTVREAARLQTFPDEYFFPHCWTQTMRQLGNAVPVALAEAIANSIRTHLSKLQNTMIRNEREYRNTLYWLERFERSIAELDNNESLKADFKRWKLQRDSYQSQVEELKEQIKEYETLTNHDSQTPIVLELDDINNLPQLLIKARMAAKLSQKELAELAGLTEEEIQRYEDKDYEDASFLDLMAVVDALDIKIQSGEFLIPLDTLRRTPITKEELLSKSWQKVS